MVALVVAIKYPRVCPLCSLHDACDRRAVVIVLIVVVISVIAQPCSAMAVGLTPLVHPVLYPFSGQGARLFWLLCDERMCSGCMQFIMIEARASNTALCCSVFLVEALY